MKLFKSKRASGSFGQARHGLGAAGYKAAAVAMRAAQPPVYAGSEGGPSPLVNSVIVENLAPQYLLDIMGSSVQW